MPRYVNYRGICCLGIYLCDIIVIIKLKLIYFTNFRKVHTNMEFNQKLQKLRKDKGLTQEELAKELFVSRTAISKWESAKGYPNIDSLKEISKFFSVSIDDLLSGEEILNIAEEDSKEKQKCIKDLVFGLLDIAVATFFFMPVFGQRIDNIASEVSLFSLTTVNPYIKTAYIVVLSLIVMCGVATLVMQNSKNSFWENNKTKMSLALTAVGSALFIISLQPYAAIYLFTFMCIKAMVVAKKQ